MLPGTILFVVGADALTLGVAEGEVPWALVGVLVGMIILLMILVRQAHKKLQEGETKTFNPSTKEDVASA